MAERRLLDRLKVVRLCLMGGADPKRHSSMMRIASAAPTIRARWAGVVILCTACETLGTAWRM